MVKFRFREQDLREKWLGKEKQSVNGTQFLYINEEQEKKFYDQMFPHQGDKDKFLSYRNEWYKRAKLLEHGDAPLAVTIELVSTCNLACTMCYTITDKFQNTVVGAQRKMPWQIVKKIIDEASEIGVSSLMFSWRGESTLYRDKDEDGNIIDFADVLKYARSKNILEITSLTHGQLINEKMAKKIVEAEPSWISFSIDGLDKTYNDIRTPPDKINKNYDAFKRVIQSIGYILKFRKELGKTRPQIRTNTIFPAIQDDPEKYRLFMEKNGVDMITVNEIKDFRHHRLDDDDIDNDYACQYPFQRLTISANGVIVPCTGSYNEEEGLVIGKIKGSAKKVIKDYKGNVVDNDLEGFSLYEAWHSKKLNSIRDLHRSGRRKEIEPGCRNCHYGAVYKGAKNIPTEWDPVKQRWKIHDHLSDKREYKTRAK
ncbi:radical SAM protein [Candidatus Pelagibacter bacterium]|jgi:MoaA/NifB/PqqE/SkfB family radical SAM enzyme|nr:radical SAM protein [Candidatus Pelagibacter bacterium]|tara:strand:- start:93 stop:1370 length:1278 start_codon:yes stop_codon:yes gene_type:complete